MKKTRVALIGCGTIGRYHFDHFKKMDDVEVVGVCDVIPERADTFAAAPSGPP